MLINSNPQLLPILSSMAGSTLTFKNWQQVGIQTFSYHLEDLLMKPGLALLEKVEMLTTYLGCSIPIILNIEHHFSLKKGVYTLKNRFDGEKINLSVEQLIALINKLRPAGIFLPQDWDLTYSDWSQLDKQTTVYYPALNVNNSLQFNYFFYDNSQNFNEFLSLIKQEKKRVNIVGNFSINQLIEIAPYTKIIESDTPAQAGYSGFFFLDHTSYSILDKQCTHDHQPLVPFCLCFTCKQNLTRAYLHHLYQKTPLLAQRYLIAHNVFYYQKHLENSSFTST